MEFNVQLFKEIRFNWDVLKNDSNANPLLGNLRFQNELSSLEVRADVGNREAKYLRFQQGLQNNFNWILWCYEFIFKIVFLSSFHPTFFLDRCGGCDTLFTSLMLLEHHKEEYEHWSDSEEYSRPCCRRNRRNDCDFSDSETCTSDAESEDLERLL